MRRFGVRGARMLGSAAALLLVVGCGGDPDLGAAEPSQPAAPSAPPNAAPSPTRPAGPCGTVYTKVTNISIPTVWKNGPGDCDYAIQGVLTVASSLTIEPGTTIRMEQDATLYVGPESFIVAAGRPDARIRFFGAQDVQGYWRGIVLNPGGKVLNRFEHVDIENAGQAYGQRYMHAALRGSGNLVLKHSKIADSFVDGADLHDMVVREFEANVFEGNRYFGLVMRANQVDKLDLLSDYAGRNRPNGEPFINVAYAYYDDELNAPTTWKNTGTPYHIGIALDVTAPLTLEPGTRLIMAEDSKINVTREGALVAVGTAEKPVVFTGKEARPGYWQSIDFYESPSPLNRLQHVRIEHAGQQRSLAQPSGSVRAYGQQHGAVTAIESTEFVGVLGTAVCQGAGGSVTIGRDVTYASQPARAIEMPLPTCGL